MRLHRSNRAARAAGFTLIELLAVILIIAVLAAALVPSLLGASESVGASSTRTLITQISTEIEAYERENGDYPPSSFPKSLDPRPSALNEGAEMLVIALMPADGSYRASSSYEDQLVNSDGDATKASLTRFESPEVFELGDHWGNPIVYLHRSDYAEGAEYRSYSEAKGDVLEFTVRASINPKTGAPFRANSFQLISAGADGEFGTEDDIGNFKKAR